MKTYREERIINMGNYESTRITCEDQGDNSEELIQKVQLILNAREKQIRECVKKLVEATETKEKSASTVVTSPPKPFDCSSPEDTDTAKPKKRRARKKSSKSEDTLVGNVTDTESEELELIDASQHTTKIVPNVAQDDDKAVCKPTADKKVATYKDICAAVVSYFGLRKSEGYTHRRMEFQKVIEAFYLAKFADLKSADADTLQSFMVGVQQLVTEEAAERLVEGGNR